MPPTGHGQRHSPRGGGLCRIAGAGSLAAGLWCCSVDPRVSSHAVRHTLRHCLADKSGRDYISTLATVILCTNRVHSSRQATGITSLRPAVHNLIMRALGVATT